MPLFKRCAFIDNILCAVVAAVVLTLQLMLVYDCPKGEACQTAYSLRAHTSSVAIAAVVIQLILHLVRTIRVCRANSDKDKQESEAGKFFRNSLTSAALVFEFIAFGLYRANGGDDLISPIIILSLLGALRLLDSILDFEDPIGALTVQCKAEDNDAKVGYVRLILVHVLILLSLGLNILKTSNGSIKGLDQSVIDLDLSVIVLISVHLGLYLLNLIIKISPLHDTLIKCALPRSKCNNGEAAKGYELVALTRVPIIRQLVAGVILAGSAYVLGSASAKSGSELTYIIPGILLYGAADALGRNYL